MQDDLRFEPDPRVVARRIADEIILVPVTSSASQLGHVFRANPVGAFIWNAIEHNRTLGQIRADLVERFEVDPEQARRDLEEFVQDLIDAGAVQAVGSGVE